MKKTTTLLTGLMLLSLASFASAYGNGQNYLSQRAKMDGSAAAMSAQLTANQPKTAEQIQAQDEYAGKALAANPADYKKGGSH